MGRQYLSADGEDLGSKEIPNFYYSSLEGRHVVHYSYAYTCPHCGEIWGRARHEEGGYWQFINRNCRKHGNGRLSMNHNRDDEHLGITVDWPRAALVRELMIELEAAER